jgi:sugar phosphate isomerase/epimerase
MSRQLSLHHLVAPEVPADRLVHLAAAHGCSYVCLFTQAPTMAGFPVVEDAAVDGIRAAMAETGVQVLGATSFALGVTPWTDYRPGLERAARLGAQWANCRVESDDLPILIREFGDLARFAADRGVGAGIEFSGFGNAQALCQALRIIEGAGIGQLALDPLQIARTGTSMDDLFRLDPSIIGHAQICDGPGEATAEGYVREAASDRLAPGEGEFDLARFIRLVPAGMPLSLEVPGARLRQAGRTADQRVRHVIEATRLLLSRVDLDGR